MPPQAPWSPNAHAFAHHQFSHVANFWKQGRQASFRLEALPGGRAELHLTFQLPPSSEVVPPPTHVSPVSTPQRPIRPLFPKGCFPQGSDADSVTKHPSKKKASSRQGKNYRRSVLHRAALAAPLLPPPKNGSLRQAAQACVQRLQAVSVSTQNVKKRSATLLSPSNLSPLAQRIRSDIGIGIGESEVESPEREMLRSQPCPENTPPPCSPCVKGFPSPAPLVFTPCKIPEEAEIQGSNVKVPPSTSEGSVIKCSNCDGPMGASHQCGDFSSPNETVVENSSRTIKNLQKFCAVCEIFYKSGTHHQCETGKPEIVKCIVCQALGRETSLVLCGSTCPSCGVPANKLPIEL